jgi:hypothetical protein
MSSGRESKLDLVGPVRDSQAFSLTLPRPHALTGYYNSVAIDDQDNVHIAYSSLEDTLSSYCELRYAKKLSTGIAESGHSGRTLIYELLQNSPNPFSASTAMSYSLPIAAKVTLSIYDITGRLVETLVNETQQPGMHEVRWDRADNPSGMYFCRLNAGEFVETRKMVVVE